MTAESRRAGAGGHTLPPAEAGVANPIPAWRAIKRERHRSVAFRVMKQIWKRKWFWPLLVLIVARVMLAIWVRDYVNRKLNEMEDYRGHIAAVDIHLWRGAYTIHEVKIE